jgi:MYXO-CTERM domain-containing protein
MPPRPGQDRSRPTNSDDSDDSEQKAGPGMTKKRLTEVVVRSRTLQLDYQTYPLANIARIQAGRLRIKRGTSTWEVGVGIGSILLVLSGLLAWASTGTASGAALLMIAVGLLALGGLLAHRYYRRRGDHVLSVEAAGGYSTQIFSRDAEPIKELEKRLVEAIEDPPNREQVIQVGNNVYINKTQSVNVGGGGGPSW